MVGVVVVALGWIEIGADIFARRTRIHSQSGVVVVGDAGTVTTGVRPAPATILNLMKRCLIEL